MQDRESTTSEPKSSKRQEQEEVEADLDPDDPIEQEAGAQDDGGDPTVAEPSP